MVPALSLWLPILLSAVFVFVASSVIHMFSTGTGTTSAASRTKTG